jgi:glucose uptake protein
MFLPSSYTVALLMMLFGMFCWGSWPNTYNFTRGWRFELFYWDYAAGIFLTSLLVGLTLGTFFGRQTFWQNLLAADPEALIYACLAGALWNIGNILLVAGVASVGLAVAFPVSIGMALVIGVVGSYLVAPRGNPALLFAGVALVCSAVIVNSFAHRSAAAAKQEVSPSGLWVCLASGVFFSGFGPLIAKALTAPRPLAPYGVNVLFTFGALVTTVPVMTYFMRHPFSGQPVSVMDYRRGTSGEHAAGLFGGFVWGLGTTFTFVPMTMVGTALAYAIGQSNPLVAALWGVFIWHEFRDAPKRSQMLLAAMFVLYIAGLLFLTASFEVRAVEAAVGGR